VRVRDRYVHSWSPDPPLLVRVWRRFTGLLLDYGEVIILLAILRFAFIP